MNSIAIIPARSGSVRIPGKNIKPFHGLPIIAYSIHAAQDSCLFDTIIVSTDDLQIAAVAEKCGAMVFMRSPDNGTRGTQEVAKEVLDALNRDGMCCVIYATAPMLTGETLRTAFRWLCDAGTSYIVPVGHWLVDPGQFYMGWTKSFRNKVPLTYGRMMPIDPRTAIDINTPADWEVAEKMYAELHGVKHD